MIIQYIGLTSIDLNKNLSTVNVFEISMQALKVGFVPNQMLINPASKSIVDQL